MQMEISSKKATHSPWKFAQDYHLLKVMKQCYNWQNEGKTEFSIQNLGQALDRIASKKLSILTHTWVTTAAMYNMKVQE